MKYEISEEGIFHYVLSELSFDDFDKSGKISIWKLSKLVEGVRLARFAYTPSFQLEDLGNLLMFVRSHSFKVYPSFYTDLLQDTSVKINTFTSHVGRTSFCVDANIYSLTTNKILANISTHLVLVSMETRRSTPIPSKISQSMKVIQSQDTRPVSGPNLPVYPSAYFSQKRTVMPSDTDHNEHLNQAALIRFCFDCAGMAALQGNLSSFENDIIYSDAQSVWVLYVSEAAIGEVLTLHCWEDKDLDHTIWVVVRQGSEVIIGQCQIQFYADWPKKSAAPKSKQALATSKL